MDGYYSSLLDQESKADGKEVDALLIEGDAVLKNDTESKPTLPQGIEKWKGQIEKVATIIKCPTSVYSVCHGNTNAEFQITCLCSLYRIYPEHSLVILL